MATLAAQFLAERGRLPTPGDGHTGQWLSSQRSALHRGLTAMTTARAEALDKLTPGWRRMLPARHPSWSQRADHLREFHAARGRWPSQTATDPDEAQLARWLSMQRSRHHRGELSATEVAKLNEQLPGWDPGSRESIWLQTADDLAAFIAGEHRWPSTSGPTARERRLAKWLSNRRRDRRTGTGWSSARSDYLDAKAPGWFAE